MAGVHRSVTWTRTARIVVTIIVVTHAEVDDGDVAAKKMTWQLPGVQGPVWTQCTGRTGR